MLNTLSWLSYGLRAGPVRKQLPICVVLAFCRGKMELGTSVSVSNSSRTSVACTSARAC